MKIALLADIHANLEALEACLASAQAKGFDRIVFLGDIVGYGADPGACVDIVRAECAKGGKAVVGNHDQAIKRTKFQLNDAAATAAQWTASVLNAEQTAFLGSLPISITEDDRLYVHASARASATFPYVRGLGEAAESLVATTARLTVCGHVHQPALYNMSGTGKVMGFIPAVESGIPMSSMRRWLAVMGAVGQPRDGNPAAAYGLLDLEMNEISFIRVPYDVETAAAKIRRAGLPDILWKRLSVGR